MEKMEKIAYDNGLFYILAVGMSMGMGHFANAVLDSAFEMSQYPTDNEGKPGYIRIDSSAIRKGGEQVWFKFIDSVKQGLLPRVSYGFSSATEFEGDLSEKVTIKRDGYEFAFHIREYERSSAHDFEIIGPEKLEEIPEDEELGRVVYLIIRHEAAALFSSQDFLTTLKNQCNKFNLECVQSWMLTMSIFAASIRKKDSGECPTVILYFDDREIKRRDKESGELDMDRTIQLLMLNGFTIGNISEDSESHVRIAYFEGDDPIGNDPVNIINYASQLFAKIDNSEIAWPDFAKSIATIG